MKNQDDEFILVATVGKPVGLKGWAKVNSFTRPPENLFNFKKFFLEVDGVKENINIDKFSKSGKFNEYHSLFLMLLSGLKGFDFVIFFITPS